MDWDTTQISIEIPDLTIRVKVRRGFLKSEWVDVKSYSVDQTHAIIKTDEIFPINDKVTLSLRLDVEPNNLVIDSVTAKVLKQKKECSCFFYFLEFSNDNSKLPGTSDSPLARLAELIRKKQLINKKFLSLSQASA